MDWLIPALVILACLILSAFFSGSETALMRLDSHDLSLDKEKAKGPTEVAVRDLLSSTSRLLVTILLGNNLVNILGAAAASAVGLETHISSQILSAAVTPFISNKHVSFPREKYRFSSNTP